jgi:hypothetical protein
MNSHKKHQKLIKTTFAEILCVSILLSTTVTANHHDDGLPDGIYPWDDERYPIIYQETFTIDVGDFDYRDVTVNFANISLDFFGQSTVVDDREYALSVLTVYFTYSNLNPDENFSLVVLTDPSKLVHEDFFDYFNEDLPQYSNWTQSDFPERIVAKYSTDNETLEYFAYKDFTHENNITAGDEYNIVHHYPYYNKSKYSESYINETYRFVLYNTGTQNASIDINIRLFEYYGIFYIIDDQPPVKSTSLKFWLIGIVILTGIKRIKQY